MDIDLCHPQMQSYTFYKSLPKRLHKSYYEHSRASRIVLENFFLLMITPPNGHHAKMKAKPNMIGGCLRRVSSSSLEYESEGDDDDDSPTHCPASCSTSTSTTNANTGHSSCGHNPNNPWLQQCHQSSLYKLKQKSDASNVVECIMLENLTFKFRHPCVLDLKMGTRQYGDDAPESKRKSQTAKASNTTTVSLGVRLAGMQVYNREKKCYICKHKYEGRQLTDDGFKQTLWHFLHNGRRLRLDIAEIIVYKLEELRAIVTNLDSVRFFTSSLLILYDGCESGSSYQKRDRECERERERENTKIQESSRKSRTESRSLEESSSPRDRESWMSGESSAHSRWPPAPSEPPSVLPRPNHSPVGGKHNSGGGGKAPREQREATADPPYNHTKHRHRTRARKPRVDIRLIDFAHATHKGMGDAKIYHGADEGIILGLDSLIKIFNDIRETYDH
ncbi:unnamed protein product, partial [Meganyctiphanes norvegica]